MPQVDRFNAGVMSGGVAREAAAFVEDLVWFEGLVIPIREFRPRGGHESTR